MSISPKRAARYKFEKKVFLNFNNLNNMPRSKKRQVKKYLTNLGFENKKLYQIIKIYHHPKIKPKKGLTRTLKELATTPEHTIFQFYVNRRYIGLGSHLFDRR